LFYAPLDQSTPEIVSDLVEDGVIMTGGLANLAGLPRYVSKKIKLSCVLSDEPMMSSIRGLNIAATHVADYKRQQL
jgi:rod shape-determining protein MreB